MKFFKILLLVLMGMIYLPVNVNAQDLGKKITVEYSQLRLRAVLADLTKKHDLKFSYANEGVPLDAKITLRKSGSVKDILTQLLAPLQLTWDSAGGQIVIKEASQKGPGERKLPLQTIRGTVTDLESKITLPGVTVALVSADPVVFASTNARGEFRIPNIPVGRHDLLLTYIGYQRVELKGILINSGKEQVLNLAMKESAMQLKDVVVSDKSSNRKPLNEMATVSARSFSVEETSRYPVSLFDPARMALNFAGVTSDSDINNDIVVRGNSPKGILWRLEGAEVINPNHFGEEGSSGGGVSMISSNMLANSDFFTGAFPAEYGNALSGVFDLQFRKGNTEKRENAVTVGLLGTEVSTEGPFRKGGKASFLVNYRYSTLALLDKAGLNPVPDGTVPVYQDVAFNLNFPSRAGTFSLFGIGGISSQEDQADRDVARWEELFDKFDRTFKYTSGSAGIKHMKVFNDKLYTRNIHSASYSRVTDRADTLNNDYMPAVYGRDAYENVSYSYTGLLNYKLDAANTFRTGLIATNLQYDLRSLTYKSSLGRLSTFLNASGSTQNLQGYIQWKNQTSKDWMINAGFHTSYFALSDSWSFEPRLGINYQASTRSMWSLGAGLHSRVEPLALYYGRNERPDGTIEESNQDLEVTKAFHSVLGFEHRFNDELGLKIESYYQHLYDVPVVNNPQLNFSALNFSNAYSIYNNNYGFMKNGGTGRNYGLEVTIERSLNNGLYYLLTTSLYDSKFKAASGRTLNTVYNGNFVSNVVAGKEYKVGKSAKNLLAFNFKMVWNGGRKYSPIDLATSIARDEQVVFEDQVNSVSTPQYFRLDVSSSFKVNNQRAAHSFYLDIQNVSNRQNLYGVYYDKAKKEVKRQYHTGLVPTINYKIEF